MKNLKNTLLLSGATMLLWTACTPENVDPNADLKTNVVKNYCDIVHASYEDSYDKAVSLQTAINSLVSTPTQATFDAAKAAWKAAREPYGQTEAYRFYDGPIDDADGPEGALNAWPLDENYIDYTLNSAGTATVNTGIIHDLVAYPNITATVLAGANEQGGEKNISIGYHAIEFLLWGQDFLDVNTNVGQGGNRSYTDYTSTSANYDRRGQYIKACAQLIIDDLAILKADWAEGGSYRTYFEGLTADEALTKILTGAGVLSKSELAGERMFTALEANAVDNPQEDEHSCFADNTDRDIITNAQGISNVLLGTYVRPSGTTVGNSAYSIVMLLTAVDATKGTELTTANTKAMGKVNAIPAPFDKTVTEENVNDNGPVLQAITALQEQGDKIAEAATALGLTISTDLPD
ncbi:imelysin family protein [Aureispira anguillae]|uniref:Peptidase M75 n=1 Tax=Aureispira anguillae TaxID=2864201 RepID=A0A915VME3_9BACT|nr:imelysin family protein [Aureispira anguillae]BDS09325.1 peptidase M75 [Aureispira anguillae]